jgi:beta-lactam-binding protein with PASTA domain
LGRLGLTARMHGDGVVIDQVPAAGSPIEPGDSCTLVLNRRPPTRPTGTPGDPR